MTRKSYSSWAWWGFAALLLITLRVFSVYTWRIDSDEPQHLHVIWGWANGLLQYRDVFDNHTPLFHMLFTPVYAALGERADILQLMRLSVIPLYLLSLLAVYQMGKALFTKESALWATLITALFPLFFLTSLEFRTDDLWIVPWLFAMTVLVQKPLRRSHFLLVGLLLGATIAVSMKTSLLLLSLLLAVIVSLGLATDKIRETAIHKWRYAIWLLVGLLVVPVAFVLFFVAKGSFGPMYYGVIQHNIVPGLGHWKHFARVFKVLVGLIPLVLIGTWVVNRSSRDVGMRFRRTVIFLTFGFSILGLYGFWPLVTRQDFLPLIPLFVVIATGCWIDAMQQTSRSHAGNFKQGVLVVLVLVEASILIAKDKPWQLMKTSAPTQLVSETLQLTHSGDRIIDLKGETVFRPRPFYYVLEGVTRKRISLGLIQDTIPEDVIRTGTAVAAADSGFFPPRGRAFLNDNFVSVGALRVAGRLIDDKAMNADGSFAFEVGVPTVYALVSDRGDQATELDGSPYTGGRTLSPGRHTFKPALGSSSQWAVVWASAIERGFSPFPGKGRV
ncbi:phosphoribosylformylglycinamidine synthase [Novimethylophilus kurashikiensis]|uniref:Phosphoribosylformylglycinamidine synthase n=1 Tax=Novimethylophilus kurashikiensis TaxID=1825523 RepID=A0A2R5FCJ0_9PROT|nr:glycosyltransferase family 39 protein [Novimethylophilus kurashikiensis]GBG15910.1 phosphoribosylformylglycinamidine synthase [Novimethylophilus kurashikiensis]